MTQAIGSEFGHVLNHAQDLRRTALKAKAERISNLQRMIGDMEKVLHKATETVARMPSEIDEAKRALAELEAMSSQEILSVILRQTEPQP